MKVLHIFGLAVGDAPGTEFDDRYIQSYDPDFHRPDGTYDGGVLIVTTNPADAMHFADVNRAAAVWLSRPRCSCHQSRPDGKPNRPLTAFTVAIEDWEPANRDLPEDRCSGDLASAGGRRS